MRLKLVSSLAAATFAVSACSDPAAPVGPVTAITLNICGGFGFSWIGFQNQGQGWQQLNPTPAGTVTFEATEKVSLAVAIDFFGSSITEVLNTTATELEALGNTPGSCDSFGNRAIVGTVAGLTGEQSVDIYGASSFAFASVNFPDWELTDLPDEGTIDLVATRTASPFTSPPDRVIVRRALTPSASGQPIAALDFATEGLPFESATLTVTNAGTDFVQVESAVLTANGTTATLGQLGFSNTNMWSYVSLPAALRAQSDLHVINAFASAAVGDREVTRFYATPGDLTVALGPMVSAPTVTQVATTPYRRLRAEVPSQTEYQSGASAEFFQSTGELSFKSVTVTSTRGYVGSTPATWRLEIPDFGNSGYQAAWGLNNAAADWGVAAFDGNLNILLGGAPVDGATVRFATRYSDAELREASVAKVASREVRARARGPVCLLPARCTPRVLR